MRVTRDGWLAPDAGDPRVERFPMAKTKRLATPRPLGLVWHYAGGAGGPGYAERLARRLVTSDRAASWHAIVAKDGAIFQSAPFDVGTWHVGLPGVVAGRSFPNVNAATVGIETENAGRLREVAGRFYCWPYWRDPDDDSGRSPDPGCEVDAARAVRTPEGVFDAFSAEQERSAALLVGALVDAYGWGRDVCAYGHRDFHPPSGKEDPGPVWAGVVLPRVLDAVFSSRRQPL